jgi:hypothetical protein
MPDVPRASEIVRMLPYRLQLRFNSLAGYVSGIIDDLTFRKEIRIRLGTEDVQLIQLAALVYTLDSFFRAGTRAAREASATFERFESSGFQVGRTHFTRDNENTKRGEQLANTLRNTLAGTELERIIRTSRTLESLVEDLIKGLNNG